MGKEKIEEKDVRLLRYAVEQAFDGAMRDETFYFVDDEYNPFVRHAPVKTMGSSTTRKTVIRRSTVTWIR